MSRRSVAARVLLLVTVIGSCHDGAATAPLSSSDALRGLVLSDPAHTRHASLDAESSAAGPSALTFVSLKEGTANDAASARVTNRRTTEQVSSPVTNGGFGPVGITAIVGDTLDVLLLGVDDQEIAHIRARVPGASRPVVVRTKPPRGKTDVPLNIRLEVVFSEPIDPASFAAGSLRLTHGSSGPVAGRVEPTDLSLLSATFVPSSPLMGNATYTIEITTAVKDLDGEALEESVSVSFTTAPVVPVGPSLTIGPDTLRLASDEDQPAGGWLVAVLRNAEGEEVFGMPVHWNSSDPDILALSPGAPSSLTGRSTVGLSGSGAAGVVDVVARGAFGADTVTVVIEPARFVGVSRLNSQSGCLLADDGRIYCHSDNQFGQLGIGIADHGPQFAVAVSSREFFVAASGGGWHACALTLGGAAYCWGHNGGGQVGSPESRAEPTPVLVSSELTFSQLSAGFHHSCGLELSGEVYCWGVQWSSLSLALDRPGPVTSIPVRIPAEGPFQHISAGGDHSCGIDAEGVAWCWGLNGYGQLGNGTNDPSGAPVRVAGGLRFTSLDAGPGISCGVTTDSEAWCWGSEEGAGASARALPATNVPARVPLPTGVSFTAVAVGLGPSCALSTDGSAWCWGFAYQNDLSETAEPPTKVPGDLRFASLSAGFNEACGVTADSVVYCWRGVAETPQKLPGQR